MKGRYNEIVRIAKTTVPNSALLEHSYDAADIDRAVISISAAITYAAQHYKLDRAWLNMCIQEAFALSDKYCESM
ncbi:hypothetical protein AGMMS49992_11660 [Clostridia bacterium]|nr:hypothetical protein AGMMS49992_11660 [Clostridia bacterium]